MIIFRKFSLFEDSTGEDLINEERLPLDELFISLTFSWLFRYQKSSSIRDGVVRQISLGLI